MTDFPEYISSSWTTVSEFDNLTIKDLHVIREPRRVWEIWKPKYKETLYALTDKGVYKLETDL